MMVIKGVKIASIAFGICLCNHISNFATRIAPITAAITPPLPTFNKVTPSNQLLKPTISAKSFIRGRCVIIPINPPNAGVPPNLSAVLKPTYTPKYPRKAVLINVNTVASVFQIKLSL